jgi:ketosteroid isomerase-like protein
MKNSAASALLALTLVVGVVHAHDSLSTRTPVEVVNHHIAAMLKHDAAALVEDYADDAVMVLSGNVLNGKQQIQKLFGLGAAPRPVVDDHAKFSVSRVDGDVVIEEWSHDAPGGGTVSGADVIVVRNGKIVFHATKPAPSVSTK